MSSTQKVFTQARPDYNANLGTTSTTVTRTHTTGAPIRTSQATRTYTTTTAPATRTYTTTAQPIRSSQVTRTYTTTTQPTHTVTTRTTNPIEHHHTVGSSALNERRLDENSARILARKVFYKYDANRSGYMNSMETGRMISDLYSSLNVDHPADREEGLEFMIANDANSDH